MHKNEDDQSNLERRKPLKPLEKTKTVVVAVVDNTDVVTKPEAEDVIVEMKKKNHSEKVVRGRNADEEVNEEEKKKLRR